MMSKSYLKTFSVSNNKKNEYKKITIMKIRKEKMATLNKE